jgi:hypothetical protein
LPGEDGRVRDVVLRGQQVLVTESLFRLSHIVQNPAGVRLLSSGQGEEVEGSGHGWNPLDDRPRQLRQMERFRRLSGETLSALVEERPDEERASETAAGAPDPALAVLARQGQKLPQVAGDLDPLLFQPAQSITQYRRQDLERAAVVRRGVPGALLPESLDLLPAVAAETHQVGHPHLREHTRRDLSLDDRA